MVDKIAKPRRRLKVFEQLSAPSHNIISRTLEIGRVPSPSYVLSCLTSYRDLESLQTLPSGQILVSFFDIRQAMHAKTHLSAHFPVRYIPDEQSDSLTLSQEEANKLYLFQDSIMEVARTENLVTLRFYDVRTLKQIRDERLIDKQFLEVLNSSMSVKSDSTSGSPQVLSGERKRPKKKPVHENEKRMFLVDVEKIWRGEDERTTIMVRNIPNKYTQKMLLEAVNRKFAGTFDFFYLPIDFKNKCNVGYAFLNFRDISAIPRFYQEFNSKRWGRFNSEKVCEVAYARIQGTASLLHHFQRSSVMSQEDANVRPLLLPS